jgi:hypothetical protein
MGSATSGGAAHPDGAKAPRAATSPPHYNRYPDGRIFRGDRVGTRRPPGALRRSQAKRARLHRAERRLRRSNFRKFWYQARGAVGLPELHFHDLRHTGNTMAAAAQGASLKELMERMGHSSTRAALIYLHATRERDQKIAAGMGKLFVAAKKAQKSVGPKGGGAASGGSPSSASRLWTVDSGTVMPKSQVTSS